MKLESNTMPRLILILIAALALVLAACSADDEAGTPGTDSNDSVRTVTATLSDDMAIQLSESNFAVGDTVRFEVTNSGASPHEFYLGDAEAQEHHAEEMSDMDGEEMHDEEDGIAVEPARPGRSSTRSSRPGRSWPAATSPAITRPAWWPA